MGTRGKPDEMECPTCGRVCPSSIMTRHHLKTRRKDKVDTEWLCTSCHSAVHALFTNAELRDEHLGLDTVEGLLANEQFAKHVAFVAKQSGRVRTRQSRRRRSKR